VVSDDTTHVKRVVFSPKLLAKVVFADPELTFDLPPAVTAATGMDALTHNIESYLSPAYHPLCDGIALEGVRIGARALATAVRNGRDLQARADMMMSSMMGAIAFQKDLGAVHSCAHALGAVCDLHHGLANALMLEPVMRFNLQAAEAKFAELAHVVGARGPDDFIRWLADLKREVGIAEKDICHHTNPRPCARSDFTRFFEEAL
jgi:alcohol dehydrogenase class IV